MQWNPPRKYKGLRTQHAHAIKVTIPSPDEYNRSLNSSETRYSKLAEMEDWCEEFCTRNWSSFGYSTWYFDKPTEAVMFKMIFGGK